MSVSSEVIRDRLLALVRDRGPEKTICPSEVARALGGNDWRQLMPQVRDVGVVLAKTGQIAVTQRGQVVDPENAQGPIRYRIIPPQAG